MPNASHQQAFTLIELLIALVIVTSLSLIGWPHYQEQLKKVRRQEGRDTLLQLASDMEQFFTQHHTYVGGLGGEQYTSGGYYQIHLVTATHSTFELSATATKKQQNDFAWDSNAHQSVACDRLTINQAGQTSPFSCWF